VDTTRTLLNIVWDQPSGNRCASKGYCPLFVTEQTLPAAAALRYCSNVGFTLVRTKYIQHISFPTSKKINGKPLQRYIHSSEVLILDKIRLYTDTYWYPFDMGLKCDDVSEGGQCRTCLFVSADSLNVAFVAETCRSCYHEIHFMICILLYLSSECV